MFIGRDSRNGVLKASPPDQVGVGEGRSFVPGGNQTNQGPRLSWSVARVIFHVDMDAFYVSVERRENPDLVGKPVIVGADTKGGRGRGVVMAASYEARQLGVRSGMPISMAWHKLPQATYLRPNYDLYAAASESVIDVLRSHADILEHVSIDEAFLDVTSKVKGFDDAADYALRVKAAVKERERLACTNGVGPNKSVAKMASDLAKPDGLKAVPPEEVNAFLDPLPVTRISGDAAKTPATLEPVGVRTIGELARFPGAELKKLMGKNSVWLWAIARGIEELPVEERPDPKSISVERTFDKDVSDWPRIESTIRDVAHNVFLRARAQGATFRTVGIKIRFEGFQTHLRERTLASHVLDEKVLADVCVELAKEFAEGNHRFRLIGVRVTKLQRPKTRQPQPPPFRDADLVRLDLGGRIGVIEAVREELLPFPELADVDELVHDVEIDVPPLSRPQVVRRDHEVTVLVADAHVPPFRREELDLERAEDGLRPRSENPADRVDGLEALEVIEESLVM